MTAFAIDIVVRASALLAAAALVDLALRRRAPAAARHLVWTLAVAALLALPLASALLPAWHVRVPITRADAESDVRGPTPEVRGPRSEVRGPASEVRRSRSEVRSPGSDGVNAVLVALSIVYVAGVLLLLARLALEPFVLRRLMRASREVTDPAWRRSLDDASSLMRVARAVRLLQTDRDVMPLTFGTFAPVIVLPASAGEWTEDRRRAVLLHELAHVARGDCLIQRLTAFACAWYWPHPGVWYAARRLRAERELACDDRVIAVGAPAREYASHLLEIAHTFRAAPAPATALGMARARQLERRLLAILDEARNRASLGRSGRTVFILAAMIVFVPLAVVRAVIDPAPAVTPAFASGLFVQQDFTGTWELHPSGRPDQVQISIRRGRSNWGRTLPLAELERLAGTTLAAAKTVHFPIPREAGTFTIDGMCRNGACAGTFVFEPSTTFAAELAKRGIGRPTPQDQFYLAIADVGTAYLDTLAAAGYKTPDIQTLVRASQHGVDRGYVRAMADLGYKLGTIDRLITLRDHGVDPEFTRGMAANGLAKLSADDLVRARDHGVDPEFVRGMAALGHAGLSLDALVTARDHGVDPEYVRGMQQLGHKGTLDDLRRTRDHGVDPEYVRGMAEAGYKGVSIDDLVRMRDHGVDPRYVRKLQRNGAKQLSVDELIYRRDRGIDR